MGSSTTPSPSDSDEEENQEVKKVENSDDSEEEEEECIEDELQVDSSILYIKSRGEEDDGGAGALLQDPLELNPVLPHISAKCKPEFAVEMQKGVNGVVQECVQVLKKDPREYHPFYLTVNHFVQFGLRQKYIPEGMEGLMWEKVDKFASSEYAKANNKAAKSTTEFRETNKSQYLKHILKVGRSGTEAGRKIIIPPKLERDFRVALRSCNKMLEGEKESSPPGSNCNLKWRLEFFRHFQLVTSPELVVPMNILWSQLLSPPPRNAPTWNDPCSSQPTPSRQKVGPCGIAPQKAKGAGRQEVPTTESKPPQVKATQGNNNDPSQQSSETPEEKEALRRAKRNERQRARRRNETPEEAERRRAKRRKGNSSADTTGHQGVGVGTTTSAYDRKRQRSKENERMRLRRKMETPEEAELRRAKRNERERARRLKKPPEEQRDPRTAKLRQETPEEAERRRAKRNERDRRRRQRETPEQREARQKEREKIRERQRAWSKAHKARMTEEQRQEAKVKQYMAYVARRARAGKEGLQYMREYSRRWRANLSGEKRAAYMEYLRMKGKERLERLRADPQKWREHNEKMLEYQREKTRRETPQARHKRLTRYKINQARRKLRGEMEAEGGDFTEEEFQKRAQQLISQIEKQAEASAPPPSAYKARPRKRTAATSNQSSSTTSSGGEDAQFRDQPLPQQAASLEEVEQPGCVGSSSKPPPVESTDALLDAPPFQFQPASSIQCSVVDEPEDQLDNDVDDQVTMEDALGSPQHIHSPVGGGGSDDNVDEEEEDPVLASFVALTSAGTIPSGKCPQEEDHVQIELSRRGEENSQKNNSKGQGHHHHLNFECDECPAGFETGEELRAHLGSQHSSTCWRCPECEQVVLSPAELKLHFQEVHE